MLVELLARDAGLDGVEVPSFTRRTWFISRRSIVMPPSMAMTWPSSEVPAP